MKTMNILKSLAAAAVMAAALVSCSSDDILNPTEQETSRTITVNLIPEGETTRTMLDADAKLRWQTGDEVSYFTSSNGTDWSTSTKAEINASTGSFSATIPAGDSYIIAIYPAVENGTEFAESLADVKQQQTYGAPLPLPMRTAATEISGEAQTVNAPYTVTGAVVKLTVTGVEAADIKAVCLGKYTCEVPDGEASDDGTFFVVVPIGSTVEYTPSVRATSAGSIRTYRRIEPKTQIFTAKAYEMGIDISQTSKYISYIEGVVEDNGDGSGTLNGHAWVDLGLPSGTLWATCNVGAFTPEGKGGQYAWGETSTKADHTDNNYVFKDNEKYSYYLSNGVIDDNGNLTPAYDAAAVNMGSDWRIAAHCEYQELFENCTYVWTTINSVQGVLFTSTINSKTIFFPKYDVLKNNSPFNTTSLNYWVSTKVHEENYNYYYFMASSSGLNYRIVGGGSGGSQVRAVIPNNKFRGGYDPSKEIKIPTNADNNFMMTWGTFYNCQWESKGNIGNGGNGSYVTYSLNNTKATAYNLKFKAATCRSASLNVEISNELGTVFSETVPIAKTSSWDTYPTTYSLCIPLLEEGYYTLRLTMVSEASNIKDIAFEETTLVDNGDGTGTLNGHAWVDLGLTSSDGKRLVFATCNIGAADDTEYGNRYSWGEVDTKDSYVQSNYTLYKDKSELVDEGVIDANGILTPEHDAATVNWGEGWRMPTKEDFETLISNTNKTWSGNGTTLTSKTNSKSINLKKNTDGYSMYWCSTKTDTGKRVWLYTAYSSANYVQNVNDGIGGFAIRPVAVID